MDIENIDSENFREDLNKSLRKELDEKLSKLSLKTITECVKVKSTGFIITVNSLDEIINQKDLFVEGSLCVRHTRKITEDDCFLEDEYELIDDAELFIGEDYCENIYIRLGYTNTWMHLDYPTVMGVALDVSMKNSRSDDIDDTPIDYGRFNQLSVVVAHRDGFNLLKNGDQRELFAKQSLSELDEDIDDNEYFAIGRNAVSFYDFGVLPLRAKKLKEDGLTEKEIAKILGHTKAKIEKSLTVNVEGTIKDAINEYSKSKSQPA